MTCMTTKKQFEVPDEEATVVVLKNGRYAYKVKCPWEHPKSGRELHAFKFCSAQAHAAWSAAHPETEPTAPTEETEPTAVTDSEA